MSGTIPLAGKLDCRCVFDDKATFAVAAAYSNIGQRLQGLEEKKE
jgi:hypothetical protein